MKTLKNLCLRDFKEEDQGKDVCSQLRRFSKGVDPPQSLCRSQTGNKFHSVSTICSRFAVSELDFLSEFIRRRSKVSEQFSVSFLKTVLADCDSKENQVCKMHYQAFENVRIHLNKIECEICKCRVQSTLCMSMKNMRTLYRPIVIKN